jgi:hypothetical protein
MGKRLTDLEKKKIIAYYVECQNYRETARHFKISTDTVIRVVKKDENIVQKATEKNIQNTKSVLEAMEERKDVKVNLLNKILEAMDKKATNVDSFTNIKDLATAYGIIMDKEIKIKELEIKNKERNNNEETLGKLDEVLKNIGGVV